MYRDFEKGLSVGLALALIVSISVGLFSLDKGRQCAQDEAVKAGVAEYVADPDTGKVWLVYK